MCVCWRRYVLDIVTGDSRRCSCFTKSYSRCPTRARARASPSPPRAIAHAAEGRAAALPRELAARRPLYRSPCVPPCVAGWPGRAAHPVVPWVYRSRASLRLAVVAPGRGEASLPGPPDRRRHCGSGRARLRSSGAGRRRRPCPP